MVGRLWRGEETVAVVWSDEFEAWNDAHKRMPKEVLNPAGFARMAFVAGAKRAIDMLTFTHGVHGELQAVTLTDDENRILHVLWERDTAHNVGGEPKPTDSTNM